MTQMEFAQLVFQYLFIYCVETAFFLGFSFFLRGEKVNKHDFMMLLFPIALISQFVIEIGGTNLAYRGLFLLILWAMVSVIRGYDGNQIISFGKALVLSTLVMLLIEAIMFIPFIFIFGEQLSVLTQNVFVTIALSIPTRVFEYIVLYVIYLRKVGLKNEKVN